MYCLIQKGWPSKAEGLFLFLKTKAEKDLIVKAFPQLIVNENPFTVVMEFPNG